MRRVAAIATPAGVVARGESDDASLPLLRAQLEQPVGRPAQLERPAGLQALAFQPDRTSPDVRFDQGGPLDMPGNPPGGIDHFLP